MALMPFTDAMFLTPETRAQPMHVGGLQLFDLPSDAGPEWVRELFEQALRSTDIAPLFRRRPNRSLTSLGAWTWEIDDDVDLEHHVRHSALPRPGRVRELLTLVSRLHGTLLDRKRPLWETHVIEGLDGDRFAVYSKVHHSMMDGITALRLLQRSLSTDPDDRDTPLPWESRVTKPRSSSRSRPGLAEQSASLLHAATDLATLGPRLGAAAAHALRQQASMLPSPAPRTMFNVPITGSRRYAAQSWQLKRLRAVADRTGTTINDVVLAMCSSSLRDYLLDADALPDDPLVAMTPVSLRGRSDDAATGNAVGVILCNLGTDRADPSERLGVIHESMETGKDLLRRMSKLQSMALSAALMTPMVLESLLGVHRIARPAFNLVISNVPGPDHPLYWNGARLLGSYPLSIPLAGQAVNITVTSYNGSLDFGVTGCRRSVPHLQRLLTGLDRALDELEAAN